ncbi:TlpA disulfide reductase family protein [Hymenobacter sp. CRA2]|uniref:TlpA disulfide reductase family protein n=1 Tax=Hymenobacter sp. CRA2 TaxID=1955620 RepID=UPI001592907B|nr:TlpA disulfide reductase family protein [Hymenobacter sp. CRA2]
MFTPILAHAQAPFPFAIKGQVGHLNAPAKVYLLRGNEIADSTVLQNGAFELKGTATAPSEARLVVQRSGRLKSIYDASPNHKNIILEPGTLAVTSTDSLPNATLKGGPLTSDYDRLQASLKPIIAQAKIYEAAFGRTPEAQRNTPEFKQRLQTQFDEIGSRIRQAHLAFAKANPASWVSLHALQQAGMMSTPEYTELAPIYNALNPALKASPLGRTYGQMLESIKDVALGAVAPDFTQKTPEGKAVSLKDYRGKYVLVDFWASWCGPCREENPAVIKAYNAYKGRKFEVLGVSLDDEKNRAKWLQAVKDDKLVWTQVSDLRGWENEAARRYHVQSIPQNYLIDPTGKIVAVNLRGEQLQATLARLLK